MQKIVKNGVKKFGKKTIVKNVNLDVYEGEFLTFYYFIEVDI